MNLVAKIFVGFTLLFSCLFSHAQVRWEEPKAVGDQPARKNRRVMRFAGKTNANSLIRIRKNKIKLYLDNGKVRWANIPKKNRGQFPVATDSDGYFSFDLYLPTTAVEIPVEVKVGKRWRPYKLNFRVPEKGRSQFSDTEKSFMAQDEDNEGGLDKSDNYYKRINDQGQVIGDRNGKEQYPVSRIRGWGGAGFSYFDTSVQIAGPSTNFSTTGSTIALPAFAFGVDLDLRANDRLQLAVRSISGSSDDIGGGLNVTGRDFNWVQGQLSYAWFSQMLNKKKPRLAFDFGLQLQKLPFFRERPGVANVSFFDNNTYNLHVGLLYLKEKRNGWGYEVYGRYLYPFSSGDTFDIESSFPLNFEFGGGVQKPLTSTLSFGVFGQLNYFSMDVSYTDPLDGGRDASLDLILFTVDARLIVHF